MSQLSLINYYTFILKIAAMMVAGLLGQTALAACPDTAGINITANTNLVGSADGNNIYFCKQSFPNTALIFAPTESQLLNKGSHAISMGNKFQSFPLGNSVNLTGFNVNDLFFNSLSAKFPNINGDFGSPSLFNFYTRIGRKGDCTDQYRLIRNHLRTHPTIFQTIYSDGKATSDMTGDNLVKITEVKLKSSIDSTKELRADISLYHANAQLSNQYFSDNSLFTGYRDCWVGVGTKVTITPDSDNVGFAGNYDLKIGVLTQ